MKVKELKMQYRKLDYSLVGALPSKRSKIEKTLIKLKSKIDKLEYFPGRKIYYFDQCSARDIDSEIVERESSGKYTIKIGKGVLLNVDKELITLL